MTWITNNLLVYFADKWICAPCLYIVLQWCVYVCVCACINGVTANEKLWFVELFWKFIIWLHRQKILKTFLLYMITHLQYYVIFFLWPWSIYELIYIENEKRLSIIIIIRKIPLTVQSLTRRRKIDVQTNTLSFYLPWPATR